VEKPVIGTEQETDIRVFSIRVTVVIGTTFTIVEGQRSGMERVAQLP